MPDRILHDQPDSIDHHYHYWKAEGPLTTDTEGRPMRVDHAQITVFPNGEPTTVRMTGRQVKANGERDKRCQWERLAIDHELTERVLAEFNER